MMTKLGKETVGVSHVVWFRLLFLERILGEVRPHLLYGFEGRDVLKSDEQDRYSCEYRGQDKGVVPHTAQVMMSR